MNDQKNKPQTWAERSKTEKQVVTSQQNVSQNLAENLVKTPRELADEARDILYEAFEKDFNLTKEEGRRKYHIAKKGSIIQLTWSLIPIKGKTVLGEGKMIMEVNSKGKLKIRLTTDDGKTNYLAEDFSNEDLIAEIQAMKMFVADNTDMPSETKFIKYKN